MPFGPDAFLDGPGPGVSFQKIAKLLRQRGELLRTIPAAGRKPEGTEHVIGPVLVLTFQRHAQLCFRRQLDRLCQRKRSRLRLADSTLDGPTAFAVDLRVMTGL